MPYMPSGAFADLNVEDVSDDTIQSSTPTRTILSDTGVQFHVNSTSGLIRFAYDSKGRKCAESMNAIAPTGSGTNKRVLNTFVSQQPYDGSQVEMGKTGAATSFIVVHIPVPFPTNANVAAGSCQGHRGSGGALAGVYFDASRRMTYIPSINVGRDTAVFTDFSTYDRDVFVFAKVNDGATCKTFVNGQLTASIEDLDDEFRVNCDYPTPAAGTRFYRTTIYPRAFSDGEVAATSEAILSHFDRGPQTVAWSAPEHDGGAPITGYEVHSIDEGGEVTRTKVMDPGAVDATFLAKPPVAVQVYALNKAGRSTPAEVEL